MIGRGIGRGQVQGNNVFRETGGILRLGELKGLIEIGDRESYLTQQESTSELDVMRKHTLTGRPLGGESFISGLEKQFGKRLRALSRGRPGKGHTG